MVVSTEFIRYIGCRRKKEKLNFLALALHSDSQLIKLAVDKSAEQSWQSVSHPIDFYPSVGLPRDTKRRSDRDRRGPTL